MPWFRVEDSFHQHPKVIAAGNPAIGLWVRCGTYSSQYLTDGQVPTHIATAYGKPREITALVRAHLWIETDTGFLMPDYLEYNPSAADIKQRRKVDAERKRREGKTGGRPSTKRDPFDD